MFGLDISKITAANRTNCTNNGAVQNGGNFIKNTLDFTPRLDRPATKSEFTQNELCGGHLKAESLDILA